MLRIHKSQREPLLVSLTELQRRMLRCRERMERTKQEEESFSLLSDLYIYTSKT